MNSVHCSSSTDGLVKMTAAYLAFHVATGCLFATVLVLLVIICLWRTVTKRIDNGRNEEEEAAAQPNTSLELTDSKRAQPKKDNEYQDGPAKTKEEPKGTDQREASHVYDIPKSSAKLDDDDVAAVSAPARGIEEPTVMYDIPRPQNADPTAAYDVPRSLQHTDQDYENVDDCIPDSIKRELDDDATYENVSPILQPKLPETHTPHYQSPRKASPLENFGSRDKLLKSPISMQ